MGKAIESKLTSDLYDSSKRRQNLDLKMRMSSEYLQMIEDARQKRLQDKRAEIKEGLRLIEDDNRQVKEDKMKRKSQVEV